MYLSFSVGPEKGLLLAAIQDVPRILIVSGPNGAGKSTMLELLHQRREQAEPGTRVMYINPNRPWRKSSVTSMATMQMSKSFRALVEDLNAPQWAQGLPQSMNFMTYTQGQVRSRDSVDDVQSLVKLSILQLEIRRQRAITNRVDAGQRGDELGFDAYEPMKRYVSSLLPHLRFLRVDTSNDADQRVLFEKLDGDSPLELELDDLSSGEKAVIGLMYPFIEEQAELVMSGQSATVGDPIPTVLIDEPELHLHPALQSNLVAYMRELAQAGQAQFILCTHSTTIIDSADDGELFVLAPPATTGGNQLLPVASTAARLEAVRELTGSAHTVTRCRPIVFIEGGAVGGKAASDQRIVELLVPESKGWVLVPARGRSEVVRSATLLREPALTGLPGLAVFALVDNDQGYSEQPEFVIDWPVAMQENLLLDVDALWGMLSSHVGAHSAVPATRQALSDQLEHWCTQREAREVTLRVRSRLGVLSIHSSVGSHDEAGNLVALTTERADEFLESIGGTDGVAKAVTEAQSAVAAILAVPGMALAKFHGKELLDKVFETYAQAAGWSGKAAFAYNLAANVRDTNSPRLTGLLQIPVRKIQGFIPQSLVETLHRVAQIEGFSDASGPAQIASDSREAWRKGEEDRTDRVAFRASILAVARQLQAAGFPDEYERLMQGVAQVVV